MRDKDVARRTFTAPVTVKRPILSCFERRRQVAIFAPFCSATAVMVPMQSLFLYKRQEQGKRERKSQIKFAKLTPSEFANTSLRAVEQNA